MLDLLAVNDTVQVRIATQNGIPFLATSAGHGTGRGYAKYQNTLNINLGNFNSVSIDTTNNRLTVGGGVTFGDVTTALYDVGKELRMSISTALYPALPLP